MTPATPPPAPSPPAPAPNGLSIRPTRQAWARARAAYLAGATRRDAAALIGVSEGALKKRAAREGWTRRAVALAVSAPPGPGAAPARMALQGAVQGALEIPGGWPGLLAESLSTALAVIAGSRALSPVGAPAPDATPDPARGAERRAVREITADRERRAIVDSFEDPSLLRPAMMARRALGAAAVALKDGDGLKATRLTRAAREIAELQALLPRPRPHEGPTHGEDDPARDYAARERARWMDDWMRSEALDLAERLARGLALPDLYADLRLSPAGRRERAARLAAYEAEMRERALAARFSPGGDRIGAEGDAGVPLGDENGAVGDVFGAADGAGGYVPPADERAVHDGVMSGGRHFGSRS